MGNARSLKRETQNLILASLASRVAAAARRAADGRPINADWQFKALAEVEAKLRHTAKTFGASRGEHADQDFSGIDDNSYALARLTHSVVAFPLSSPDLNNDETEERMVRTMTLLADNIEIIRNGVDSPERRNTARELNEVFKRVSAVALAQFGSPGDTLGEIIKRDVPL